MTREPRMACDVDILIPTCSRPTALAVTLTSLCAQDFRDFTVIVSDQTENANTLSRPELEAVFRVLRLHGNRVHVHRNLPRRGMAQQRQFLLEQSRAPYVLFLDDDLILEPHVVGRMHEAIREERCGFVGCAVIGLSYLDDVRPHEQAMEFWEGPVEPELVTPELPAWRRHVLHNAANLRHLERRLGLDAVAPCTAAGQRKYRVAWVGGCVMYDAAKLRAVGGFDFWRQLPERHCGEDVLAQLRVMARFGGCGLIPSGVYHQELPTTVEDRRVNAPEVFPIEEPENRPICPGRDLSYRRPKARRRRRRER